MGAACSVRNTQEAAATATLQKGLQLSELLVLYAMHYIKPVVTDVCGTAAVLLPASPLFNNPCDLSPKQILLHVGQLSYYPAADSWYMYGPALVCAAACPACLRLPR